MPQLKTQTDKKMSRLCEICRQNKTEDILQMPGVAYCCPVCTDCQKKMVYPYWIVISQIALCGGIQNVSKDFYRAVLETAVANNKTTAQVNEDIEDSMRAMGLIK